MPFPNPGLWLGLVMVLDFVAILDCLRRRDHRAWMLIIVLFPIFGAAVYFFWTYNLLGVLTASMEKRRVSSAPRRSRRAVVYDVVGEGTPAELESRGERYLARGRHDEAVKILEEVLDKDGPSVPLDVRYNLAMAYKALKRYRDARDQLSLIVGDEPRFRAGQAFLELADCHYQMNEDAQARKLFEQLLKIIRFPEARYKYGILLDHLGETKGAVEQMRLVVSELDTAPEFHRRNNRKYAKLAKKYLKAHGE